jgi:hypothetical protein
LTPKPPPPTATKEAPKTATPEVAKVPDEPGTVCSAETSRGHAAIVNWDSGIVEIGVVPGQKARATEYLRRVAENSGGEWGGHWRRIVFIPKKMFLKDYRNPSFVFGVIGETTSKSTSNEKQIRFMS